MGSRPRNQPHQLANWSKKCINVISLFNAHLMKPFPAFWLRSSVVSNVHLMNSMRVTNYITNRMIILLNRKILRVNAMTISTHEGLISRPALYFLCAKLLFGDKSYVRALTITVYYNECEDFRKQ